MKVDRFKPVYDEWIMWQTDSYEPFWWGYTALEDDTNIPLKDLRWFFKTLEENGIAKRDTIYDSEGLIIGSGWFTPPHLDLPSWDQVKNILLKEVKK